jgi:hypothetical protein
MRFNIPFALSLSKCPPEWLQGFDRLSPNGRFCAAQLNIPNGRFTRFNRASRTGALCGSTQYPVRTELVEVPPE